MHGFRVLATSRASRCRAARSHDPIGGGAVIGGVARDLGVRTGIDPLWFRLAFVGLTAFSGLGVVLYFGAWLFLRGQRRSTVSWLSVLGVLVIVGGFIVVVGEAGTIYVSSPWTIVILLAGATVALWQPRAATGPTGSGPPRRTWLHQRRRRSRRSASGGSPPTSDV